VLGSVAGCDRSHAAAPGDGARPAPATGGATTGGTATGGGKGAGTPTGFAAPDKIGPLVKSRR
jgi:hypothetical protein